LPSESIVALGLLNCANYNYGHTELHHCSPIQLLENSPVLGQSRLAAALAEPRSPINISPTPERGSSRTKDPPQPITLAPNSLIIMHNKQPDLTPNIGINELKPFANTMHNKITATVNIAINQLARA
jgi:hypothetical protein